MARQKEKTTARQSVLPSVEMTEDIRRRKQEGAEGQAHTAGSQGSRRPLTGNLETHGWSQANLVQNHKTSCPTLRGGKGSGEKCLLMGGLVA